MKTCQTDAFFSFHHVNAFEQDGKLHVIYSHSDFTRDLGTHGLPTQRIRRAVLDVRIV